MNELGRKIAAARKDRGITQTEFAEKLNVTRQTVSRWEAGTVLPDIEKIPDIASLLQVSCDYLLKDDIQEERNAPVTGTGKLLAEMVGKKVRLQFFDGEADPDLYERDCLVLGFEGSWIKISAETKKGVQEKLIPLSSVLSLMITEEA